MTAPEGSFVFPATDVNPCPDSIVARQQLNSNSSFTLCIACTPFLAGRVGKLRGGSEITSNTTLYASCNILNRQNAFCNNESMENTGMCTRL